MRGNKKAVLLFEVVFVVFFVSIIAVFLFRGYGNFIKTGKRASAYLNLALLAEQEILDLKIREAKGELSEEMEVGGQLGEDLSWQLSAEETQYGALKKCLLQIRDDKNKKILDTIVYLKIEEGPEAEE